jgi:uncharacterized protein (TIGR00255 family)
MSTPLRSMTGFGSAAREAEGLRVRLQLRSVNQRHLRVNVRSRPGLGPLEKRLRDAVSRAYHRGNVDITVDLFRLRPDPQRLVNAGVAASAVEALRGLVREHDLDPALRVADLLQVPGLFDVGAEEEVSEADWPLIEAVLAEALRQATGMREAEGAAMAEVLADHAGTVGEFHAVCGEEAPAVIARLRERLRDRLLELGREMPDALDETALEREILFHADRADITEELDRIGSHLEQFRQTLQRGGEAGKRLEFLAQELLREVNTIASKCGDGRIAAAAVDAKLAIEKIKEQVANLE